MNVTVTDVPFAVKEKQISLNEILKRYVSFVQDNNNIKTVEKDITQDDGKRYSLQEIRNQYACN
ncbi:MAG: hypothetical protein WCJ39_03635 [bacterium]|jgi:hypothetical protein